MEDSIVFTQGSEMESINYPSQLTQSDFQDLDDVTNENPENNNSFNDHFINRVENMT